MNVYNIFKFLFVYEPRHEKNGFFLPIVNAQLVCAFVIASKKTKFFFQGSTLLLRLCRLVCVRPGREPRRPGFLHGESHMICIYMYADHALVFKIFLFELTVISTTFIYQYSLYISANRSLFGRYLMNTLLGMVCFASDFGKKLKLYS